jgi:prepilin-type N-terminal cleavage/methylation domain-containing protein
MRHHPLHSRRVRAFTLVELLVVLAIMAILIAGATLGLKGLNSSGKFNQAVDQISGILEQGRAYAVAQDTYVWVVLYETSLANGPKEVYVGAFGSNDGTDPFGWTAATVIFPPGTVTIGSTTTTLTQITRLYHFKGAHLQNGTLPDAPTSPAYPATAPAASPGYPAPIFQLTTQSESGPVTLSNTSPVSVYWVIQFTPTGAARNGPNPIDSIWLGMQPSYSQTVLDTKNIASLKVDGLSGLTTIYRQ